MLLFALLAGAAVADDAATRLPPVTVYKTPSCGCCVPWVKYLRSEGFQVEVFDLDSLDATREKYRIPTELQACHTALVDGYLIEGHVSAEEVRRLLAERPKIRGLFVPGMPAGAPGMEGGTPVRYEVIAETEAGERSVFATHDPAAVEPPAATTRPAP